MKRAARILVGGLVLSLALSAADIAGLWTGQISGRGGEKQDISFQFKLDKNSFSGKMFGDEFDVPVQNLRISGDRITFFITTTNYYDATQTRFDFSGTITAKEIQLTRERAGVKAKGKDEKAKNGDQTFTLKRLT